MSRADVLAGQLAEASGWPAELSALGRIPGEDPGGDGPSAVLMSSFGVEILRPRCRPRLGRILPKV
jgi:hypothetical protein